MQDPVTSNPLMAALTRYFERSAVLGGLVFTTWGRLDSLRGNVKEGVASGRIDPDRLLTGRKLIISDLTEWPAHGWRVYYPTGASFEAEGWEYIYLVDQMASTVAGWSVAQSFESFETYLYDVLAYLMEHSNSESNAKVLRLPRGEAPVEEWGKRVRARWRKPDNRELLSRIRRLAPHLEEVETANNRSIDLSAWYSALTEVRHALTHSGGLIKAQARSRLNPSAHNLLSQHFSGTEVDGGYMLRVTPDESFQALELLAEYAFGIFKSLSLAASLPWRVLPQMGEAAD